MCLTEPRTDMQQELQKDLEQGLRKPSGYSRISCTCFSLCISFILLSEKLTLSATLAIGFVQKMPPRAPQFTYYNNTWAAKLTSHQCGFHPVGQELWPEHSSQYDQKNRPMWNQHDCHAPNHDLMCVCWVAGVVHCPEKRYFCRGRLWPLSPLTISGRYLLSPTERKIIQRLVRV